MSSRAKGSATQEQCHEAHQFDVVGQVAGDLSQDDALGPVNTKAFDVDVLFIDEAGDVNTHPNNYSKQLLVDPNFYIGQLDVLTERFDTLIQQ